MIIVKLNGYLTLVHLSNIELYYTAPALIKEKELILKDEEFHHCVNVMRNSVGDKLFVTDGEGKLYESEINKIKEKELFARIKKKSEFENKSDNIWFCIPVLKNPDRLKFAFEKCVELGITNFILFSSKHSISKRLIPEKFEKTTLAAMKQSLRTYLPVISSASFNEIMEVHGTKILFDQNAKHMFAGKLNFVEPVYFLFGPEGGFDNYEIEAVELSNRFSLSSNRLRSETAILKCASLLEL
jgi:16S rRNA (uracil1498-N3)-methyltransferase